MSPEMYLEFIDSTEFGRPFQMVCAIKVSIKMVKEIEQVFSEHIDKLNDLSLAIMERELQRAYEEITIAQACIEN